MSTSQLSQTHSMFNDLVREALAILFPAISVIVWLWASFVALFDQDRVVHGFTAVALLLLLAIVRIQLGSEHLKLNVAIFLLCITAIVTLAVFGYANKESLFLFSLLILLAAVLVGRRTMWLVAVLIAGLTIFCSIQLNLSWSQIGWPLTLQLLTTLTAALSAHRLYTALEWALTLAIQTQQSAEDARNHRFELQRALQSLDIALSRLERANRTLAFAQEAAEKAYRFKSDFVANVSHELRTPLNLIIGFSEMMTTAPESYGGVPLPREYRGDMLATYRSARHLLDLINDVLDLSQIESGKMAIFKEQSTLQVVIEEALDIVRGLAEARKLALICEMSDHPIVLELDRIRVRQVLLNLLTNAMRYTQVGWVKLSAESRDGEVQISVADSGRGISPEKLNRAFETFDRMDEEPLKEGSGLGLAISKKFVELHDGRMWIESELGKGTTVTFTLRMPTTEAISPASRLRISRPLRYDVGKPLVLILHDDPRATELLRRHVENCDFVEARNVQEAEQVANHEMPQAVVTDIGETGRLHEIIGSIPALAQIPVLSWPLPSMRHLGTLMGATDYLPKPVGRNELVAALARLDPTPETVLVIDDDPHIVRLIGRMLRSISATLRVLEAFGGEEGLEVARSQHPDAIFVDLMMPGMSGHKFIEAMRGDLQLAATPIIVVSVRSVEDETSPIAGEVKLERSTGFTMSELLAVVQSLLATITRSDAISPASAAARLANAPDPLAL